MQKLKKRLSPAIGHKEKWFRNINLMKIAVHASDLDHERIDGTRVYLLNLLRFFGNHDQKNSFCIYHCKDFNPQLTPPTFTNYLVKRLPGRFLWTQLRFAWEIFRDKPDVLWMPVHNIPLLRRKNLKVVVTIHDLAFKIFPEHFPKKDLVKLNRLADLAIKNANHLIAISDATKKDILKFYPHIDEKDITVVNNGFDSELFQQQLSNAKQAELLKSYNLEAKNYLLYVGAIQPRKNLIVLIEAFEKLKTTYPDLKLVLAGGLAWQYGPTLDRIAHSPYYEDILVTGTLPFEHLPVLYQNAAAFIFPPLYEGFGIPVLEAMASGVPTVVANNSSLPEVAGDSALYFQTENSDSLKEQLEKILSNETLRQELIKKGLDRARMFSWGKCAQQTLDILSK